MSKAPPGPVKRIPTAHLRFKEGRLEQWFVQYGYEWISPILPPPPVSFPGMITPDMVGEWRDVPSA